mgnify:CR=1 FL=1
MKKRRLQIQELNDKITEKPELEEEDHAPKYTIDSINHALFQLPDGYRVVFTLYLIEGYDHKEIAEILEISDGTVKSRLFYATKYLAQNLDHFNPQITR